MAQNSRLLDALAELKKISLAQGCIKAIKHIPRREGNFHPFPEDVHPALIQALHQKGISQLYSHQYEAWEKARQRKNIIVVTPTASGKTLCYNLPVLQAILENPSSRAIYLFPTKALSQDQRAELEEIINLLPQEIRIFTYNSDQSGHASYRHFAPPYQMDQTF